MRVCDGRRTELAHAQSTIGHERLLARYMGGKDFENLDDSASVEIEDQLKTVEERMALPTEKASELLDGFLKLHQAEAPARLKRFERLLLDFRRLVPVGHSGEQTWRLKP